MNKKKKNNSLQSDNDNTYINSKKKKRKKLTKKQKIIVTILIVIIVIAVLLITAFIYLFGGMKHTKIPQDNSALGINDSRAELTANSGVVNIALYGVDSRANTDKGLSDAIMIASVDKKNGTVKIISIARDTYVSVDEHDKTKINEAYSYGGPVLAIKTLNQNFDMDIRDYITVNFGQLADVINSVDGVDINITDKEREQINLNLREISPNTSGVSNSGQVHLNGEQAVAYCRIRHIDSDNARTQRQRKVLQILFDKAKGMNPAEQAKFIHNTMPLVETSMSYDKFISLAGTVSSKDAQLKEMAFPNAKSGAKGQIINKKWFYVYDLELAKKQLFNFIYNDQTVE